METRSLRKARELNAESERGMEEYRIHNSSTLIARLPNEVLSAIFLLYKSAVIEAYRQGNTYGLTKYGAVPWISPTHVCTSWRSVALECAAFWSSFILENPRATRQLLLRSKQHPLVVAASRRSENSLVSFVKCLSIVLKESQRIETFDLSSVTRSLRDQYWRDVSKSMPAAFRGKKFPTLRTLTLEEERWPQGYTEIGQPLLLNFLKQPLKRLSDFRMKICSMVFLRALPSVTANALTNLTLFINIQVSFTAPLLSFLATLPNLQQLNIEETTWDDPFMVQVQSDPLPSPILSSLHSLTLIVRPRLLKLLLESVRLSHQLSHCKLRPRPPSANIDVVHTLVHLRPLQPAARSASIEVTTAIHTVDTKLSTYRESTAIERQTSHLPAGAWAPQPVSSYRSSLLPQIDISLCYSREPIDGPSVPLEEDILAPVESLLQDVEVLALRLHAREDKASSLLDSWLTMLGRLPRLRRLDFWWPEVGGQRAFLSYLSESPLLPNRQATARLQHFKNLQEVHFERASFFHGPPITDTADVPPTAPWTVPERRLSHEPPQPIEDLFYVLGQRRAAEDNVLKALSFSKSSGVDSEVVRHLKRVVDEVVWDKVVVWPYQTPMKFQINVPRI